VRNLLAEAPRQELHGIPLEVTNFISDGDVRERDVLDIGCGFGWFELFALSREPRSVTGIEVSDQDLQTARTHLEGLPVNLQVGSAIALPFDDASFDTVVCCEVLEHIPHGTEPQAFSEIARVLRPDGRLYLSTPHASVLARVFDPAWWLIGHRHYRTGDLRRLAATTGFTIEALEVRGGRWLVASLLNLYIAKWIFRRQPFFERYVNARVDAEMQKPGWADCFLKCRR
jgi:2-polyprenyl-3-methyl-5-hydroxy-6-metoxy-1,4-benzoquinol methylase